MKTVYGRQRIPVPWGVLPSLAAADASGWGVGVQPAAELLGDRMRLCSE